MTGMPWLTRRDDTWAYKATLVAWFVAAYAILMTIPFAYDQLNRGVYEDAKASNQLIIQEFSSTMEAAIVAECKALNSSSVCAPGDLYDLLSKKKLIALDYVGQMENKAQTNTLAFATQALLQLASLFAFLMLILATSNNQTWRFVALVSVFLLILIGFHILSDLPHKNTKYYYVFGIVFAITLSTSDFFHRLEVTKGFGNLSSEIRSSIAKTKYSKWTSVFQFSMGLMAAVVGTMSFTLLGYIRTVFGESFVFYPLLGILISIGYLSFLFYFGILRNILLVLSELEDAMTS